MLAPAMSSCESTRSQKSYPSEAFDAASSVAGERLIHQNGGGETDPPEWSSKSESKLAYLIAQLARDAGNAGVRVQHVGGCIPGKAEHLLVAETVVALPGLSTSVIMQAHANEVKRLLHVFHGMLHGAVQLSSVFFS